VSRFLFDIETDGLLVTLTKVWMMVITNLDTGVERVFCTDAMAHDPTARPTEEFITFLEEEHARGPYSLTGHFIIGFDLPALKKVYHWVPPADTKVYDTMLMSQTLNYKRFGMRGHSLEVWGNHFGVKKPEHEDWYNYSPEMLHRCKEDVRINKLVLGSLSKELAALVAKKPLLARSIRIEHDVLHFCALAEEAGWLFDTAGANALLRELEGKMKVIEDFLVPQLAIKTKIIDKEPKWPRWLKDGRYDSHTARYFDIPQEDGFSEWPLVLGEYQRFEYEAPDLGNMEDVKKFLYKLGWEPDDWNWGKGPGGEPIKKSPKLTTTSLLPLGKPGEMIDEYYTLRSRHQIVNGWVESVGADNRLRGSCFTIATPTGRARHNGIVNVPKADEKSLYGAQIRALFISPPGRRVVGADSAGNQMRAFCHYLKNPEYTNEVINGDVHTKNRDILREVVAETSRGVAKPFLYAFLFGAGSEKCGLILTGRRDSKIGKKAKDIFTAKTPGLKELIAKIMSIYDQTKQFGEAWIPAIDGRKIFVDSPHKALNYLLQSCEAVTCKAAVSMFMSRMATEHPEIPYIPLIFYHDEFEVEVNDEHAAVVAVIMKECFRDAPKEFGVMIMDGEAKIGGSWYDVH
jgi:DNA polymerase-1